MASVAAASPEVALRSGNLQRTAQLVVSRVVTQVREVIQTFRIENIQEYMGIDQLSIDDRKIAMVAPSSECNLD